MIQILERGCRHDAVTVDRVVRLKLARRCDVSTLLSGKATQAAVPTVTAPPRQNFARYMYPHARPHRSSLFLLLVHALVLPAASITATLHYNASVAPLDSITALANKVALSSSSASLNPQSSVTISAPDNPPDPQLVPEVWYTALAHCKVRSAGVEISLRVRVRVR